MTTGPERWEAVHADRSWGTCAEPCMARFMMTHVEPGKRVLDVGCGVGAQTFWLAENGYFVIGVDVSRSAINRACDRTFGIWPGEMAFHRADICQRIEFADGIFDAIIDVSSLQHVDDFPAAIDEVVRLLKPGGWLFSMAHAGEVQHSFPVKGLTADEIPEVYKFKAWASDYEAGAIAIEDHRTGVSTVEWIITAQKRVST